MTSEGAAMISTPRQFARGLATQANVIGALLMRELHTRYGRENIGYLWMVLEPMTLAVAVSSLHAGDKNHLLRGDIHAVPFAIIGYCVFIIFRGIFTRAEGALEANTPLLYHRMVTIFDILFSRALLEWAGVGMTLIIMLGFSAAFGMSSPPARPLDLMLAVTLMVWFSFALSMIACAATHDNRLMARLVHPVTYILMPISGAFYQLQWLPKPYRTWLSWFPMTQIFELARYGQFHSAKDTYVNMTYVLFTCMTLTYLGLVAIKVVRRHVHLR
jgi:capsular polysaccharide transport system permease protein